MSLKDIFKNLKLNVVGTKTSDIDSKLDNAIKDISSYKSQSGRNGYIDLVRSLISKNSSVAGLDTGFGTMSQGALTPSAMGQGDRLLRYKTYDSIIEYINYCKRALDVLTDNILSPDDITKISLDIKPKSFLEDETPTEAKTSHVKETIKRIKLEKNLGLIVRTTMGMGDFFVEIADSKTAVMSRSIISEAEYLNDLKDSKSNIETLNIDNVKIKVDFSSMNESEEQDDKKETNIEQLVLVFHDPKRVIKLQSEMFPFCFGYLIFPRLAIQPSLAIQDQTINQICTSILRSVEKRIPQIKEVSDNEELRKTIEFMLKTSNPSNLSVRFVSSEKIQHFQVPSLKYYPYGESIFDSCKFSARVLIALETALTIHRLNRSTEKRKIGIEVGLPRDSKKLIENIKEEFRKRKVSIDTFGTIDTIPSSITTFEDVYIPMRDGKPYVDISTFNEGGTDVRGKVDELKLLRDQLVASLGIPPAFLGIEEGQCVALNTLIRLVDNRTITLEQLIDEHKKGIKHEVYSYDHKNKIIFSNKVVWAGKTRLQTKILRVHLDNGKYIDCTEDHKFLLRDGETYIEAKDLEIGQSLMPLYQKEVNGYKELYQPAVDKFISEHRTFYQYHFGKVNGKEYGIHHINENKLDNSTDNLVHLIHGEHLKQHNKYSEATPIEKFIEENKENVISEPHIPFIEKICMICNKQFSDIIGSTSTCCSESCHIERKRLEGLKSWKIRKHSYNEYKMSCSVCGKKLVKVLLEETYKKEFENKFISCGNKKCAKTVRVINSYGGIGASCKLNYYNCEVCGKLTMRGEGKSSYLNTCSLKCMNSILAKRAGKSKKLKAQVKVSCGNCGKEFYKPKWETKDKKYFFCENEECRRLVIRKIKKESNAELYKDRYEDCICQYCGDSFRKLKSYPKITCGKMECHNKLINERKGVKRTSFKCSWCREEIIISEKEYMQKSIFKSCKKPECKENVKFLNHLYKKYGDLSKAEFINCSHCGKEVTILPKVSGYVTKTCTDIKCINNIIVRNRENSEKNENQLLNHKVVMIEEVSGFHDTGDITVETNSNFAVDSGVIIHNSWKTTLSEENMLFARTIIAHQKYLSEQLNELIQKIYNITNPEDALTLLDNVHISFMAPKSLQFEREARYMGELATLVRTLEEVGVPKEYSKKKYLHGIDWDEVENYEIDSTIDKKVGVKKDEEGGIGGMGGMGGGF